MPPNLFAQNGPLHYDTLQQQAVDTWKRMRAVGGIAKAEMLGAIPQVGGMLHGALSMGSGYGGGRPGAPPQPSFGQQYQQGYAQFPGALQADERQQQAAAYARAQGIPAADVLALQMMSPDPTGPLDNVRDLAAIKLLHASPHQFKKFELTPERFMTGEGTDLSQSHGLGGYFSHPESPEVHSFYTKSFEAEVPDGVETDVGGILVNAPFDKDDPEHLLSRMYSDYNHNLPPEQLQAFARQEIMGNQQANKALLNRARERYLASPDDIFLKGQVRNREKQLAKYDEMLRLQDDPDYTPRRFIDRSARPGYSYETEVDVDEHELLREDVGWSEQSDYVKDRIRAGFPAETEAWDRPLSHDAWSSDPYGHEIREKIGEYELSQAGVHGQRFPDHPAKKQQRTHEVMFDGPTLKNKHPQTNKVIRMMTDAIKVQNVEPENVVEWVGDTLRESGRYGADPIADGMLEALDEMVNVRGMRVGRKEPRNTYNVVMFPGSDHLIGEMKPGPLSTRVKGGLD